MIQQNERLAALSPEKRKLLELMLKQNKQYQPFSMLSKQDRALIQSHIEDAYPLGAVQLGMLYHMNKRRESDTPPDYHNVATFILSVDDVLDMEIMQHAVDALVAHEPMLRTSFDLNSFSMPLQLVHKHAELKVGYDDLRQLNEEEQKDIMYDWIEQENFKLIAVESPSLVKMHIHQFSDVRFAFSIIEPHSISDGWSTHLNLIDICNLYFAKKTGAEYTLEKNSTTYAEFIQKEQKTIASPEAKRFWQEMMKHFAVSELPAKADETEQVIFGQHRHDEYLPPEILAGLNKLVKKAEVPLKSVLLAAHARLISLMTGQQRVTTGLNFNGRLETKGSTNTRGMFLNILPVTLMLEGVNSWVELAQQAYKAEIEVLPYRNYPLGVLQAEYGRRNLFNTAFNFLHFHSIANAEIDGNGKIVCEEVIDHSKTNFDFNSVFNLHPTDKSLLEHKHDANLDRFPPSQLSSFYEFYELILKDIGDNPEADPNRFDFLTPKKRQELIQYGLQTTEQSAHFAPVHKLFEQQVLKTPNALAIDAAATDDALTYSELNAKANRLAAHLESQGIGADNKIAMLIPTSIDVLVVMFGIMKAGAAYIPIDVSTPLDRINQILSDSAADLLIFKGEEPHGFEGRTWNIDQLAETELNTTNPTHDVSSESPCYVLFTSGTTGRPKGVVVSHNSVSNYLNWAVKSYTISDTDMMPLFTSLAFDLTVTTLFAPLICGAGIRVFAKTDLATTLSEIVADRQLSLAKVTPAHLRLLATLDIDDCTINRLIVGGEQLSSAVAAEVTNRVPEGVKIFNEYGPTEATVGCMIYQYDPAKDTSAAVPIGKPIDNTRIYILDKRLHPVLEGITGEVYIGGAGLATGYLNDDVATAAAFVNDPFHPGLKMYKTGDLASRSNDGDISFIARSDNQANLNGFRIELGEIEARISQIHEVANVVLLVREINTEKQLAVHIIPLETVDLSNTNQRQALIEKIKIRLKQHLPNYMVPNHYAFQQAFPLTANGKIDRNALLEHQGYEVQGAAFRKPKSDVERSILEIWRDLLKRDVISVLDNFFDIGGSSLLSFQLVVKMKDEGGFDVSVTDVFEYSTIRSMASYITSQLKESEDEEEFAVTSQTVDEPIAVVGMSGRFPDADNVESFWENLKAGHESIHWYSDKELAEAGIPNNLVNDENYVKAGAPISNIRTFDAEFFHFTPRETQLMDPQQRLLLEVAVEALDDAGYGDSAQKRNVGVFVGVGESFYFVNNLMTHKEMIQTMAMEVQFGNGRDFSATRLSHKLNLDGPALTVSTACSTSLVAIHQAVGSILRNECRMALAGGAKVGQFGPQGYMYQEGGILSKTGHCRTFDADATGTRSGDGSALLVLKRLSDAIKDRDNIYGVIKGSALNNDGTDKAGYTAPSITGQASVIRKALRNANVSLESVGFIEAHGTGTALGDSIEVKALNRVYTREGSHEVYLGAVKPNIGHLDAAAGVVGVVKALHAVKHGQIPPSVNFQQPNPSIEFANGPFTVNSELIAWPDQPSPRRAGVSSFGIGGTNAHLILEQAPELPIQDKEENVSALVMVSARSKEALEATRQQLIDHLARHPELAITDVAHTLRVGRTAYAWRDAEVVSCVEELESVWQGSRRVAKPAAEEPAVIFMFPGQGSQYLGAAASLYQQERRFASYFDECAELFAEYLDADLRKFLIPNNSNDDDLSDLINQTHYAQAILFTYSWSLGQLLVDLGIKPDGMIGHSIGEYAAATMAGVMSLKQAVKTIALRSSLMHSAVSGHMVSVGLPEQELQSILKETGAELASINSPNNCVVSVASSQLDPLLLKLESIDVDHIILHTSHAFHSSMMQSAVAPLIESLKTESLNFPRIPFVSNVTGAFADGTLATAEYWGHQLREPVRFSDGLKCLLDSHSGETVILLEVGPGTSLSTLARKQKGKSDVKVLSCQPHAKDTSDDYVFFLKALGEYWKLGGSFDHRELDAQKQHYKVSLPSYPFQRREFWIDSAIETTSALSQHSIVEDLKDTFYRRHWKLQSLKKLAQLEPSREEMWMVIGDNGTLTDQLIMTLKEQGREVVEVRHADEFTQISPYSYTVNAQARTDFVTLSNALQKQGTLIQKVIHCAGLLAQQTEMTPRAFQEYQTHANNSAVYLMQALTANPEFCKLNVSFITTNSVQVNGCEHINPAAAVVSGLALVAPQEYPGIKCQHIDLDLTKHSSESEVREYAGAIVRESLLKERPFRIALRNQQRWVSFYSRDEQTSEGSTFEIRKGGVYLITGGLGNIGLAITAELTERYQAKVVLVNRRPLPADDKWQQYVDSAGRGDELAVKISAVQRLVTNGAEIKIVQADVSDAQSMEKAFDIAEQTFGSVHGVIHAAGQIHNSAIPLSSLNDEDFANQYTSKVNGLMVLDSVLEDREPDFIVLMSSLATVLGGLGFTAYAAANAFMDSFVAAKHRLGDERWFAINWDGWDFDQQGGQGLNNYSVSPSQGVKALLHALATVDTPQLIHATGDLHSRIKKWVNAEPQTLDPAQTFDRPDIMSEYVGPDGSVEQRLVEIWQQLLGINQIGVLDSFFELGGDSLLITRVIAAIRQEFKVPDQNLSLHEFFTDPTIKMLASHIANHQTLAQMRHKELIDAGKEVEEGEL